MATPGLTGVGLPPPPPSGPAAVASGPTLADAELVACLTLGSRPPRFSGTPLGVTLPPPLSPPAPEPLPPELPADGPAATALGRPGWASMGWRPFDPGVVMGGMMVSTAIAVCAL